MKKAPVAREDPPPKRRPPVLRHAAGFCRCETPLDIADDDWCWQCKLPIEGGEDDE